MTLLDLRNNRFNVFSFLDLVVTSLPLFSAQRLVCLPRQPQVLSPLHGSDPSHPWPEQISDFSFTPLPPRWVRDVLSGDENCRHTRTQLPFCCDRPFPLSCGNLTCPPRTITRRTLECLSQSQHKKKLFAFRDRKSSIFFFL